MAIPIVTALNMQSGVAQAALAPIPAASGGLLGSIMGGLGSILGPAGMAAGLLGGSSGMFGGGMDSSSASTTTTFYAGDMQVGGSKEFGYIMAAITVLLIIVLARGKNG